MDSCAQRTGHDREELVKELVKCRERLLVLVR
jgi:hypothetical protein